MLDVHAYRVEDSPRVDAPPLPQPDLQLEPIADKRWIHRIKDELIRREI
jgi:hypothetical protein